MSPLPSLHLRHSSFSNPFRRFTYITAHSPTLPLLHLRHSSFSNPFRHFTYITAHSPTLPLLHLRHSSFSNPSFASPTSQDFHLRHLASRFHWKHCCHMLGLRGREIEVLNWYILFLAKIQLSHNSDINVLFLINSLHFTSTLCFRFLIFR